MNQEVEAVYEDGVLRPLEPLSLVERQRVHLTISDTPMVACRKGHGGHRESFALRASALATAPTIEEVRAALASIPGSVSHDVIAERGEY